MRKKSSSPSFVLCLKLKCNRKDINFLNKMFQCCNKMYNALVKHIKRQMRKLWRDKRYGELLDARKECADKLAALEKQISDLETRIAESMKQPDDKRTPLELKNARKERSELRKQLRELKPQAKECSEKLDEIKADLTAIRISYGLTEPQLETYATVFRKQYTNYIYSDVAENIASTAAQAMEKVLIDNGKEVHYRKIEDLMSLQGKTNSNAFMYKGQFLQLFGKHIYLQIPQQKDKQRWYYDEAIKHRVKYVRIKRRMFAGGWQYYCELVLEGKPPVKHLVGDGRTGIDIGTSSVAVINEVDAMLETLDHGLKNYDAEIAEISRAMDTSLRATNPDNYNEDGTAKKGKHTWVRTQHYKNLQFRLKTLYRRRREALKQHHDILANRILANGGQVYVENMNFAALQKNASESHGTGKMIEVTDKAGNKKLVEKQSNTHRFGNSLRNHAPSLLINTIKQKAEAQGGFLVKVNTVSFKASQFDHLSGEYIKVTLNTRTKMIGSFLVQRDLYSAFLLYHSNESGTAADRQACLEDFERFLKIQKACIDALLISDDNNRTFGLDAFREAAKAA